MSKFLRLRQAYRPVLIRIPTDKMRKVPKSLTSRDQYLKHVLATKIELFYLDFMMIAKNEFDSVPKCQQVEIT